MMHTFIVAVAVAVLVADGSILRVAEAGQVAPGVECREIEECRRLALEARDRGAYEAFHDLAWRVIQTGRRDDPESLYLLARAQSLSNRPTDALVTLKRLAAMGVVYDAATNEDLRQVRALPGWPQVAAMPAVAGPAPASPPVASSAVTSSPAASATVARPPVGRPEVVSRTPPPIAPETTAAKPAPLVAGPKIEALAVAQAVHFSATGYVPGGLAYDSVSRRFLVGDLYARKLLVVGEGSDHVVDMVRAESARFQDVTAME